MRHFQHFYRLICLTSSVAVSSLRSLWNSISPKTILHSFFPHIHPTAYKTSVPRIQNFFLILLLARLSNGLLALVMQLLKSVHIAIHLSKQWHFFYFIHDPSLTLLFHSFTLSFIHIFIHSFLHPFIYSFIHSFIPLFIHLFSYSFIWAFTESSFMNSLIHPFLHSKFINLFIYDSFHLFI